MDQVGVAVVDADGGGGAREHAVADHVVGGGVRDAFVGVDARAAQAARERELEEDLKVRVRQLPARAAVRVAAAGPAAGVGRAGVGSAFVGLGDAHGV